MCEFIPFLDGCRVPPWRADQTLADVESCPTERRCQNCENNKRKRGSVKAENCGKKPRNVSVPCPFVRQADDIRECRRSTRKSSWMGWLVLVSIFIAPLLGSADAKVCESIDVRNTPENLKNLTDCEVVEGSVQILLIESANASAYANYTFPKLREITDYLLLYRAFELTTLAHMFPNLAVIRGQNLFSSYALVIWEMNQMKEIGLPSLVDIMRGSVRIEKNDNLCFANTIDWDYIAPAGVGGHVIKANQSPNVCSSCPAQCPVDKDTNKPLCWNHSYCQKKPNCPEGKRYCYKTDKDTWENCDAQCVGGCSGPYHDQCFACKNVFNVDSCVETCPIGTYLFRRRRCISMEECINIPKPPCGEKGHFKPFNKTCIEECPVGYKEEDVKDMRYKTCVQCNHTCPKICPGQSVNNLATIQALRGCTTIDGALEISVNGANNIVAELEENLKNIEEVRDYVKIVRSYPLVDLGFLRNLKKIGGANLENGNALIVRDNENLEELFGNTTQLKIKNENATISFSFNARLCYRKIMDLSRQLGLNSTDAEVSRFTNGQKASCWNGKLEVNATITSESWIAFTIKNFRKSSGVSDHRQLLGYEYHYREAPFQNISKFGGRDACGNDGWITGDIRASENSDVEEEWAMITHLKPFTQYGFYFNTLTVPDESFFTRESSDDTQPTGATSQIIYVTTISGEPNPPMALHVVANTSSEMYISWKAPVEPNAQIMFYYVQVELIRDDGSQLAERDYCKIKLEALPVVEKKPPIEENIITTRSGERCPGKQLSLRDEEESQKNSIDFENDLHNTVYVKRSEIGSCSNVFPGRQRRDLSRYSREVNEEALITSTTTETSTNFGNEIDTLATAPSVSSKDFATKFIPPNVTSTTTTPSGEVTSYGARIEGTSLDIKNLRHFGNYRVTVRACRDDQEYLENKNNVETSQQCSKAQYETVRTRHKENADAIENSSVSIVHKSNGTDTVLIEWERPANPNGLIVSYTLITHTPLGWDKEECIPVKELRTERTESFQVSASQAGVWKFQLLATSLAGNGPKTQVFELEILDPPEGYLGWVISMVLIFILGIVCFFAWQQWRKKKMDIPKNIIASFNPDYLSFPSADVYIPDEYEVSRDQIQFVRELGQGSFGMVYEGILSGPIRTGTVENMRCAIKTVNEGASVRERIEFLNEASVMKAFVCNHVVKLLGVVSKGQPTYVVMELMAHGDLKTFLRSLRPDNENSDSESSTRQPPTLKFILKMAIEIADGMAYLAAKKYVHRDLAARNCMVAENLTVKIGDFGMTRDIYETDYYRKGGKGLLPVRWMSPESLKDGVFTSQSDVWSFGVVLWEMATLASQPYQGLSNEQVLKYVMDGGRMEMPEGCPEILYNLMLQCWRFQPKQRPRFVDVVEQLLPEVESNFPEVSFYHSQEGQEFLLAERQERPVIHELPEEDEYGDSSSMRKNVPDQTVVEILDVDYPDDDDVVMSESHDEEEPLNPDGDFGDHAPLTYSAARRPFIDSSQARNGNSHLPSTDSSKTASDSSKSGSHLSNGSVTNGYVNRRRDAPAEC